MQVPPYTPPPPPPQPGLPPETLNLFNLPEHHAQGGPSGTDTIPSWLSPGEHVLTSDDVNAMGGQDAVYAFRNALHRQMGGAVQYFDLGGAPQSPPPPQPQPVPKPQPQAPAGQQPSNMKAGDQGQPGHNNVQAAMKTAQQPLQLSENGIPVPGLIPGGQPGGSDTRAGLNTPGSSQRTMGQDLPPSGGIGFGGGVLGAAEGAAAQAAGMAADMGTFGGAGGAASSAMNMAFQLINRTAAFGAQAAGIGVEGLLETFIPNDSPLSDFGNTLPGRILTGIAGVRPAQPNSAGKTEPPLKGQDMPDSSMPGMGGGGGDTHNHFHGDIKVEKPTDFDDFTGQLKQQHSQAQAAIPANTTGPQLRSW